MPAWVNIIYRIITAVSVKIKSVGIFGINILGAIRRDKSTPLRVVIACVEVVELSSPIVVISSVSYGIGVCDVVITAVCDSAVAPRVVGVLTNLAAT